MYRTVVSLTTDLYKNLSVSDFKRKDFYYYYTKESNLYVCIKVYGNCKRTSYIYSISDMYDNVISFHIYTYLLKSKKFENLNY